MGSYLSDEFAKELERKIKRKHRGTARGKRHFTIEEREEWNKTVRKVEKKLMDMLK